MSSDESKPRVVWEPSGGMHPRLPGGVQEGCLEEKTPEYNKEDEQEFTYRRKAGEMSAQAQGTWVIRRSGKTEQWFPSLAVLLSHWRALKRHPLSGPTPSNEVSFSGGRANAPGFVKCSSGSSNVQRST